MTLMGSVPGLGDTPGHDSETTSMTVGHRLGFPTSVSGVLPIVRPRPGPVPSSSPPVQSTRTRTGRETFDLDPLRPSSVLGLLRLRGLLPPPGGSKPHRSRSTPGLCSSSPVVLASDSAPRFQHIHLHSHSHTHPTSTSLPT